MEPIKAKELGDIRQPQPVVVALTGEFIDVEYWSHYLIARAGHKGDDTQMGPGVILTDGQYHRAFSIYPRAVND